MVLEQRPGSLREGAKDVKQDGVVRQGRQEGHNPYLLPGLARCELVVRTVLTEAEGDHPAGTIVATPFRWQGDLRARQLRKQAR